MLDSFFVNGFQVFQEPLLLYVDDISVAIQKKYLSPIWSSIKLIEFGMTDGIKEDDYITRWHNDSKWGMNLTCLYYIDTMTPETGGSISIRNGIAEETIYPSAGTLIIMSQEKHVQHKVEYTEARRRVINADFYVG